MRGTPDPESVTKSAEELYHLMPLQFFYSREGVPLPEIRFVDGAEIPEPERTLLVHDTDMTPTLTEYHDSELILRVIQKEGSDDYLLRLVDLVTAGEKKIVEFGAIGIRLESLPDRVRKLIRECVHPLGGILNEEAVPHSGKPSAYFEVKADALISESLREPLGATLYGRCNQLMDKDKLVLADVVEILPSKGGPNPTSES